MNDHLTDEEKRALNRITLIVVIVGIAWLFLRVHVSTNWVDAFYVVFNIKLYWGLFCYQRYVEKNNGEQCFKTLYAFLLYRWY